MPVKIEIHGEDAYHAQREMLTLLDGAREVHALRAFQTAYENSGAATMPVKAPTALPVNDTPRTETAKPETAAERKAREKAEKAAAKAAEKQSIQTGEDRVGPEDDDPNDEKAAAEEAQDEADEKADKETTAEVTHESVRNVLGEYVKRFGMPAAQEDGPKVIALMFGKDKSKVSDIPDDQASLKKAVAGVSEMLAKNPFKREPVKAK